MVLSVLAIFFYLLAGGLLAAQLLLRDGTNKSRLAAPKAIIVSLSIIAVVLHAIALSQKLFIEPGVNLGFYNAGSLAAWMIAALLVLATLRAPVENLGIVIYPLAALGLILELTLTSEHLLLAEIAVELRLHILSSFLAYSIMTLAALQSGLLFIQIRQLHNKQPGGFIRALPPLETMESLLFQMLWVGFVLQSLSILSGMFYLEDMFAQHLAHKTIFSILAWSVYAILLFGRWRHGWRGRKAIRWTQIGFIFLLLAYFGSKWVTEIILQR